MVEENNYLLIESLDPTHPRHKNPEAEQALSRHYQAELERYQASGKEINPKMQDIAQKTKEWIRQRLIDQYGVPEDQIYLTPHIISHEIGYKDGRKIFGTAVRGSSLVLIDEAAINECIEDQDLRDFLEARVIFEELWHNTAKTRFRVSPQGITEESSGLSYVRRDGDRLDTYSAVEEGLAQIVGQSFVDEFLAQELPDGWNKFKNIVRDKGYPPNSAMIFRQKGGDALVGTSHVEEQELAYEILYGAFNGNIGIIERARITHNMLPVARKVNATYGSGAYEKIFSTPNSRAAEMTSYLKGIRKGKKDS